MKPGEQATGMCDVVQVQRPLLHYPQPKGSRLALHAVVCLAHRPWLAALRGLRAHEVGRRHLSEVLVGLQLSCSWEQGPFQPERATSCPTGTPGRNCSFLPVDEVGCQ